MLRFVSCSESAGGVRTLMTDRTKLVMAVGGVTALAAGVYTTRFAQNVILLIFFFCFSVFEFVLFR